MKRGLLVKLGHLYQDIMHNTLFFDILGHLPHGLAVVLVAVAGFVEQHGTTMAFVLAIVISLLKSVLGSRASHPLGAAKKGKKAFQKRDKRGRFIKASRKER